MVAGGGGVRGCRVSMLLPPELWTEVASCLPWTAQLQLRATARSCGQTKLLEHWWKHRRTHGTGTWLTVGRQGQRLVALQVDWAGQLSGLSRLPPIQRQVRQVACSSSVGQSTLWWALELDGRLWQGSPRGWSRPKLPPMRFISASSTHAVGVDMDGQGWGLGRGKCAAVALGRKGWRRWGRLPCPVPLCAADAGLYATVLLDRQGGVWTCGENMWEQLGQGVCCRTMPVQPVPTLLPDLPPMRQVRIGAGVLALVSASSELWLGGWCSFMASDRPLYHSSGVKCVHISDYHVAVVRTTGTLWTGGYFPQDGKLARPSTEAVKDGLAPTGHAEVRACQACTLGVNRACTAWAGADGRWQWAGASLLAT